MFLYFYIISLLKLSSLSIQALQLLSFFLLGVIRFGFAIVALKPLITSTFSHLLWYFFVQVVFAINLLFQTSSFDFLVEPPRIIVEISQTLVKILRFGLKVLPFLGLVLCFLDSSFLFLCPFVSIVFKGHPLLSSN